MCLLTAAVLSLIPLVVVSADFDHCRTHTTDTPGYPCLRDLVFVLDASTSMKTVQNVERELDYVQHLISNWTFGPNGVRVAFSAYGFDSDISFSFYFDTLAQCNKKIASFRKKVHSSGLSDYRLTDVIENIEQVYGSQDEFDRFSGGNQLFRHRVGVEPRFIVFSSTTDSDDIRKASPYFKALYERKYGTVLCVDLAATSLYSRIKTLKTIDMEGYTADVNKLEQEVVGAICLHDGRITPAPCPTTTTQSTTTAPPTTRISFTTTTPLPTTTTTSYFHDRAEKQCSCTASNLWLDIVIAIDTSASMSADGVNSVLAFLATWIPQTTVDPSRNQSVRIALVTFDTKARILADLQMFTSVSEVLSALEQIEVTNQEDQDINVEEALRLSGTVFERSDLRKNAQNVILLVSSAYKTGDPLRAAEQLKASGVSIITVSYEQEDETSVVGALGELASPGMAYNSSDNDLVGNVLNTFCWINCYCQADWMAYKSALHAEQSFGECVRYGDIDSNWMAASRIACPQMAPGGHLTYVFTRRKHEFLRELAQNYTTRAGPVEYFIGLSHEEGGYYWVNSSPQLRLTSGEYQPWNPGFPKLSFGKCVIATIYGGFAVGWRNVDCLRASQRYICQAPICDTDNYCASV